jgi:hypothetical protein
VREIGLPLLWLALLLLPFDVGVRRLIRGQRSGIRGQAPAERPAYALLRIAKGIFAAYAARSEPQPPTPTLDRLREAQEQARRRARGEE